MKSIFVLFCLLAIALATQNYKPVILIHGFNNNEKSLSILNEVIKKDHPGTITYPISLFNNHNSTYPLWEQLTGFQLEINKIMAKHPEGVHLIGYSQGGIISRAIIEATNNHNIKTFISLSSPQMGQYGCKIGIVCNALTLPFMSSYLYTPRGQNFSVGNFWNDPYRPNDYLRKNIFLPIINNQVTHPWAIDYKTNFCRLNKLVLIGGPNDGSIRPWQSSIFGFYEANERSMIPMERQEVFTRNTFGLRTLFVQGKVHIHTKAHTRHVDWVENKKIIREFVIPYLD